MLIAGGVCRGGVRSLSAQYEPMTFLPTSRQLRLLRVCGCYTSRAARMRSCDNNQDAAIAILVCFTQVSGQSLKSPCVRCGDLPSYRTVREAEETSNARLCRCMLASGFLNTFEAWSAGFRCQYTLRMLHDGENVPKRQLRYISSGVALWRSGADFTTCSLLDRISVASSCDLELGP